MRRKSMFEYFALPLEWVLVSCDMRTWKEWQAYRTGTDGFQIEGSPRFSRRSDVLDWFRANVGAT